MVQGKDEQHGGEGVTLSQPTLMHERGARSSVQEHSGGGGGKDDADKISPSLAEAKSLKHLK